MTDTPTPADDTVPSARELLKERDYLLFWGTRWMGSFGTQIQSVAMGWLIYDLTKSAAWLGRVGFAGAAPTLFLGLLGGALIEGADYRRILGGAALVFSTAAFGTADSTSRRG